MKSSTKVVCSCFSGWFMLVGLVRIFDLTLDEAMFGITPAEARMSHVIGWGFLIAGGLWFVALIYSWAADRHVFQTEEARLRACERACERWAKFDDQTRLAVMQAQNDEAGRL